MDVELCFGGGLRGTLRDSDCKIRKKFSDVAKFAIKSFSELKRQEKLKSCLIFLQKH